MTATRIDISLWFDDGKKDGYDYLIVAHDTFDHDNYPLYAHEADFEKIYCGTIGKNMQACDEVYDLRMNKELQMNERRAFHYPKGFKPY